MSVVALQHEELAVHDDTWVLEQRQAESLVAVGGERLMEDLLSQCIPDEQGPQWGLAVCIEKAQVLTTSNLARMGGARVGRRVTTLLEALLAMLKGQDHLDEEWADSDFLQSATPCMTTPSGPHQSSSGPPPGPPPK